MTIENVTFGLTRLKPITPLNTPFPNITPFTVRDNATYIMELDDVKRWVEHELYPFVSENIQELADSWIENANVLINAVNDAMGKHDEEVTARLNQNLADAKAQLDAQTVVFNEALASMRSDVDAAVQAVINNAIEVSDPVTLAILEDADSQTRVFLEELIARQLTFITPFAFGAIGDGVADDTLAVQRATDLAGISGGTVIAGRHRTTAPLLFRRPNVTLLGGTFLPETTFAIAGTEIGGTIDLDLEVSGTTVIYPSIVQDRNGFELGGARRVNFRGLRIFKAWNHLHIYTRSLVQHTRRVVLDAACGFHGGNSGIFTQQYVPAGSTVSRLFGIGDFHVIGMQFSDLTNTIKLGGVDGIVISGVTSFQAQNPDRERGIDIDCSNFVRIVDCSIFESGTEGIRLSRFQNAQVLGNTLAWPGQRVISDAILLENGDRDGFSNSDSVINNNIIEWPTRHGIYMADGTDGCLIGFNRIKGVGSAAKFTGDPEALKAFEHWGIRTPVPKTGVTKTSTPGNVVTGDDPMTGLGTRFSFNHAGPVEGSIDARGKRYRWIPLKVYDADVATLTAEPGGAEGLTFNHPGVNNAKTVVTIGKEGMEPGSTLFLHAYTSKTTILNSSAAGVQLKGNISADMPQFGTMLLRLLGGVWREVSRSW